jgi:hypothetical protein
MNKEDAWAWISSCADMDGRRITQFEVMEGPEKGKKLFKGNIMLQVRTHPDPRVQPQKVPFEFDFPSGKSLSWCKKNFDAEGNRAVQEWEAAQKKAQEEVRRQVVPVGAMPKGILGADGKPIKG